MLSRNLNLFKSLFVEVKNMKELKAAVEAHPNHVFEFTSSMCNTCKKFSPLLYKKQAQSAGKWTVIKVDVDDQGNSEAIERYFVAGLPKLILVKNGQQIDYAIGPSSQGLDEFIKLFD